MLNVLACLLLQFFFRYFTGKYYYEATVTDEGLCRVGWSTQAATLELGMVFHSVFFKFSHSVHCHHQIHTFNACLFIIFLCLARNHRER